MQNTEKHVVALTQAMIQQPSSSGEEKGVSDELVKFFEANGFDEVHVDKYGNTIGTIKGDRPGNKLLFDGHMDTVPVGNPDEWTHPPFEAQIHDGKIYGRGASDMKGAIAAMAVAAVAFRDETDGKFAGEINVAGVVHEECFEGVAAREISKHVQPDFVIIGEASQGNVKIGQRGRAELKVEVFGKPAHSANPEKGINAVYKMCKIIEEIRKLEPTHHESLGDGILELVDIKSSPYPGASVVPEHCLATYDRRLLTGETPEGVIKPLEDLIERMMKEDPELKAKVSYAKAEEVCFTGETIEGERFFPGWLFEENESWVQDTVKELNNRGLTPEVTQYNFCTNGSHYAGEAGIKALGLGPSKENLAHTVDEYIEIDQLNLAVDSYQGIMKALLK